jgi:hypothetical protein
VLVVGETPPLNEIREMEGWQSDWLRFAEQIYRDSAPDPEESEVGEIIYWIDAVASRYCSKIDAHSRFVESFSN